MIEKNPVMKTKCLILSNQQSLIIKKNWVWFLFGISNQVYNIISLSLFMRYCHYLDLKQGIQNRHNFHKVIVKTDGY